MASVRLPPPLSPATINRDGVDVQFSGVLHDPSQARHAVVQPGGERLDLGRRRGRDRIAEVDHGDREALGCEHPGPDPVGRVERAAVLHAATVDVVDARHDVVALGPDVADLDRVAVGRRGELVDGDRQSGRRCDLFGVERVVQRRDLLAQGDGLGMVADLEQRLAAVDVGQVGDRNVAQRPLHAGVESGVVLEVGHVSAPRRARRC